MKGIRYEQTKPSFEARHGGGLLGNAPPPGLMSRAKALVTTVSPARHLLYSGAWRYPCLSAHPNRYPLWVRP